MSDSDLYLRVREQEGRLYTDEIVARLPEVPADDPLKQEWDVRRASLKRFMRYVNGLPRPMRVLELGCGNGWLSHHLAALPDVKVWGVDRESRELAQAARVFAQNNLAFLAANIFQAPFRDHTFNIILIASAIQYFADLPKLIRQLCRLLSPRGELHIMDSPVYDEADVQAAQERTQAYYAALGFPEMASDYFHHTYAELKEFSPRWLHRPDSLQKRLTRSLGRADSPFPWLCIG